MGPPWVDKKDQRCGDRGGPRPGGHAWTMRSANEDARAKMKIAEQVQMADRIRAHGHIS